MFVLSVCFKTSLQKKKIGTTQNQLALVETNLKRSASLSCMVSLYNFFLHCVESEHLVTLHILNYCIKNICLISFQLIATKSSFILLLVLGIRPLHRIWQCVHVTRQAVQENWRLNLLLEGHKNMMDSLSLCLLVWCSCKTTNLNLNYSISIDCDYQING